MSAKLEPRTHTGTTAAQVQHLTDFAQAAAFFRNWQGRFEQLSNGPFAGTLQVVRGQLVRVVAIHANQRVLLRGRDASGHFSVYPVIPGNADSMWQGRRLAPGQLVIHGTDSETDHCSARNTEDYGVSLSAQVLDQAIRFLRYSVGHDVTCTWAVHTPSPESFHSFRHHLTRMLSVAAADGSYFATPEGHQLEQACIRSLVTSLFTTPAPLQKISLPGRTRLLHQAEEFMRSHLTSPIGVIDLCGLLNASDRTLRLAFRERYGLGPMEYYKRLRLNAVRSALNHDSSMTIAAAATQFGFHHLGNFAADYRRLFGELPSETTRGRTTKPIRFTNPKSAT